MAYRDCKLCNNVRIVLVPDSHFNPETKEVITFLALMACPAHGKEPEHDPAA